MINRQTWTSSMGTNSASGARAPLTTKCTFISANQELPKTGTWVDKKADAEVVHIQLSINFRFIKKNHQQYGLYFQCLWSAWITYLRRTLNPVTYKLRYRYISFYAIYCSYLMYPFRKTTAPTQCFTQLNTHACQKERIYAKNNFFSSKQNESPGRKRKRNLSLINWFLKIATLGTSHTKTENYYNSHIVKTTLS